VDTRLWAILHKEKRSKSYFGRKKSNQIQESKSEDKVVPSHVHKKKSKEAVVIDSESESSLDRNCSEERDVGIVKVLPRNDEGITSSKSFL